MNNGIIWSVDLFWNCFTWLSVDKFNQAIYTMLIIGNLGSNDRMSDFNLIGKKLV